MLDFEWTNRTLFSSAYQRATSFYPNSEFSATGLPVGQEWLMLSPYRNQLPPELFTQPFKVSSTEGRGIGRDTLRQALTLLNQAGWKLSGQRLLNAKGQPLKLEILLVNPNLSGFCNLMSKIWRASGSMHACAPLTAPSTNSGWTSSIST